TCAEDPTGVTAVAALGLAEGSPLGAAACKATDATVDAFADPARSPGSVLESPPRSVETAEGAFTPTSCVEFVSGEARVVTCAADDTKLQVVDLERLDAVK